MFSFNFLHSINLKKHFAFLLTFFIGVYLYFNISSIIGVWNWNAPHWLFVSNQELGFVKRSLPGTILYFLVDLPLSIYQIKFIGISFSVVVSSFLLFIVFRALYKNDFSCVVTLLFTLFLLSPFTVRHIFSDSGRFNIINLVVVLIFVLLSHNYSSEKLNYILLILSPILFFVHEAFILIFFPLLLVSLFIQNKDFWDFHILKQYFLDNRLKIIFVGFFILITFCIPVFFGGVESKDVGEFVKLLESRATFEISNSSVLVLFRSFSENINHVVEHRANFSSFIQIPITLLLVFIWNYIPLSLMYHRMIGMGLDARKRLFTIIVLSIPALSPLLLFFLGTDIWRWISYSILNTYILYFLFALNYPETRIDLRSYFKKYSNIAVVIICICSILFFNPSDNNKNLTYMGETISRPIYRVIEGFYKG
ncbi:MAG: hypothetical protein ABEJ02_04105 [Candidatus Paceibacteria bacterium]